MVHFESGVIHRHAFHPLTELTEEHGTAGVEILVVHPQRQNKVAPFTVGNFSPPRHLAARLDGQPYVVEIEGLAMVDFVRLGHIGIKEIKCLFFLLRHRWLLSLANSHGEEEKE